MVNKIEKQFLEDLINNKKRSINGFKNIDGILIKWEEFRDKIASGNLELNEYTNRVENGGEFLTHFLNLTTSELGRSREGNTKQLMLQMNEGCQTYYLEKIDGTSKNEKAEEDEANKYFQKYILPLLKTIISLKSIDEISNFENNNNMYKSFVCKQMLRKILVLESLRIRKKDAVDFQNKLLQIYKEEAIDFLIDYFGIDESDTSYSKKGYDIVEKCFQILENSTPTNDDIFYLSKVLWDIYAQHDSTSPEQPNIIFYGAPGTGKTYEVLNNIKVLVKNNTNRFVYIQCHPGFGYEDFIEGIKPVGVTSSGSIRFSIVNGVFKELCMRAKNDLENTYYFIADEINRTDISSMFGETLSLIESSYRDDPNNPEKRHFLMTQSSNLISEYINQGTISENDIKKYAYEYDKENKRVYFGIPKNVRFIGMMNDVDKSIDTFDLALRRRFAWERKEYNPDIILYYLLDKGYSELAVQNYVERCNKLNDFIASSFSGGLGLGVSYQFGHSYFLKIEQFNKPSKKMKDKFNGLGDLFDKYLSFILKEYIRSFKEEDEVDTYLKKAKELFSK